MVSVRRSELLLRVSAHSFWFVAMGSRLATAFEFGANRTQEVAFAVTEVRFAFEARLFLLKVGGCGSPNISALHDSDSDETE